MFTEADTKKQNQIESKSDVISIELPNEGGIRKRKKKGFDMEAYVKRQLGRVQRELQMLKHHAHVLCLLSHLRYLNSFAAFPPGKNIPQHGQIDLNKMLGTMKGTHQTPKWTPLGP